MKRTYKEMGKCDGCRYLDWVDKKWWGCTTKVCTFRSRMGKALPQHKPIWCPLVGLVHKGTER